MLAVAACTTFDLTPELEPAESTTSIPGVVEYDGNIEFLPTRLAGGRARYRFAYETQISYEAFEVPWPLAALTLAAFFALPTGTTTIRATGELVVRDGDVPVRTYRADAKLVQWRNFYYNSTHTRLRRSTLCAIRDSIDAQIARDAASLVSQ